MAVDDCWLVGVVLRVDVDECWVVAEGPGLAVDDCWMVAEVPGMEVYECWVVAEVPEVADDYCWVIAEVPGLAVDECWVAEDIDREVPGVSKDDRVFEAVPELAEDKLLDDSKCRVSVDIRFVSSSDKLFKSKLSSL